MQVEGKPVKEPPATVGEAEVIEELADTSRPVEEIIFEQASTSLVKTETGALTFRLEGQSSHFLGFCRGRVPEDRLVSGQGEREAPAVIGVALHSSAAMIAKKGHVENIPEVKAQIIIPDGLNASQGALLREGGDRWQDLRAGVRLSREQETGPNLWGGSADDPSHLHRNAAAPEGNFARGGRVDQEKLALYHHVNQGGVGGDSLQS